MFSSLNPLPQLPKYQGPYRVGSCEYEVPVSEIPSGTPSPDATIATVKFRVYYPTSSTAKSKTSIPWLPAPQKEGNRAYAQFLGFSERSSGVLANLPSVLSYPTIPAVHDAPLLESAKQFPVAIFSHGLGGNSNTYSSFVGSLASCGVVVIAPEHRDQSAPISFVRASKKSPARPVPYRRLSHQPSVAVLNARNEMLRIRLWELEKLFAVVTGLNDGKSFTNCADTTTEEGPSFVQRLDLSPSKVTWAGHSFGAATVVQFVKSVYYRQLAPPVDPKSEDGWDYTPLYSPADNTKLAEQITSSSPLVLLDLWTMPLTAKSTSWLWEKPLPCYDRETGSDKKIASNVISILSTQFYKWPELVNRTKALLSKFPAETYQRLSREVKNHNPTEVEEADAETPSPQLSLDPITKLENSKTAFMADLQNQSDASAPLTPSSGLSTRTSSPAPSVVSSVDNTARSGNASLNSSVSSLSTGDAVSNASKLPSTTATLASDPQLYLVPTSAHLSQSDFGVLFPNVTKYLLKTIEPTKIMELNVRAATSMMRQNGIDVANLTEWTVGEPISKDTNTNINDEILLPGVLEEAVWQRIDLST